MAINENEMNGDTNRIIVQAYWFDGYFRRQLQRAGNQKNNTRNKEKDQ